MESIEHYNQWLDNLDEEERDKYQFLMELALRRAYARKYELMEQYNIRWNFALNKKSFAQEELFKESEELTKISFPCDWGEIQNELKSLREQIRQRATLPPIIIKKEELLETIREGEDDLKEHDFLMRVKIGDEYYLDVDGFPDSFFKFLMYTDLSNRPTKGLSEDYLKIELGDGEYPDFDEYDITILRDFDKLIELMGRFMWMVKLMNIVESGGYNTPARNKQPKKRILTLEDACGGATSPKYIALRKFFIDAGLCDKDTLAWKSSDKKSLAAYFEQMQEKGYTGYLEKKEREMIVKNSFHTKIGRTTLTVNSDDGNPLLPKLPPFNR